MLPKTQSGGKHNNHTIIIMAVSVRSYVQLLEAQTGPQWLNTGGFPPVKETQRLVW